MRPFAGGAATRWSTALACGLAVLLGASACSLGPPEPDPPGSRAPSRPSGQTDGPDGPDGPATERLRLPPGFDGARGWTRPVPQPESRAHRSWAVAPKVGLLLLAAGDGAAVRAVRLAGGKPAWTFTAPTRLENAKTDLYAARAPDGEEMAVVVRTGTTAGKGLSTARRMVTADTVRTGSSGTAKAARHFEFAEGEVSDFTGALLVTEPAEPALAALDPLTGKRTKVARQGEVTLASCRRKDLPPGSACTARTTAEFATAAGTVATYSQDSYCDFAWRDSGYLPCADGFTVGKSWNTAKVAPRGAADATPLAVTGEYIVVDWTRFPHAASEKAAGKDVVAVHRLRDGRLVARADCDITSTAAGQGSVRPLAAQHTTGLSASRRYLVSGQVGFDLRAKKGVCFADTPERRGVTLTAVDDAGRAFGVTYRDSTWADVGYGTFPQDFGTPRMAAPGQAVQADLTTGTAEVLPDRTALPVHVSARTGLFLYSGTLAGYAAVR